MNKTKHTFTHVVMEATSSLSTRTLDSLSFPTIHIDFDHSLSFADFSFK